MKYINFCATLTGYVVLFVLCILFTIGVIGCIIIGILDFFDWIKRHFPRPIAQCKCRKCIYKDVDYCTKLNKNIVDNWFCADAKTPSRTKRWIKWMMS